MSRGLEDSRRERRVESEGFVVGGVGRLGSYNLETEVVRDLLPCSIFIIKLTTRYSSLYNLDATKSLVTLVMGNQSLGMGIKSLE